MYAPALDVLSRPLLGLVTGPANRGEFPPCQYVVSSLRDPVGCAVPLKSTPYPSVAEAVGEREGDALVGTGVGLLLGLLLGLLEGVREGLLEGPAVTPVEYIWTMENCMG